jgi:hypothetical protein
MPCNFFAVAALLTVAIALVPATQAEEYALSPGQLSLVDQTCSRIMGLRPGERYFALCRENLLEALAASSAPAAPPGLAITDAGTGGASPGKSFYEVSPNLRWIRERSACDRLGFIPGSRSFDRCVDGLVVAFLPRPD